MKSTYLINEGDVVENIRVLIVEDDPMVADINKNYTEAVKGFSVVGVAKTGKEAIALLNSKRPDLLLLDIYLPESSGVELLSRLRKEDRPVDVIMITAADDSATVAKVLRQGVIAYIAKPFKFDRYRAVLEGYRKFRQKIQQKSNLEQEEIDNFLAIRGTRDERDMPKNIQNQTLTLIVDYLLNQQQPLSAEEVAAGVGISRATTRRYLEYLENQNEVEMELDYISVGRPIHRFRLARRAE